jgi:hypothetical protein
VSASRTESSAIDLTDSIKLVRGQRVIVDSDLASLYGVPTKRLNEAVKRNRERFPADFAFPLSAEELSALKSQFATSKPGRGGRRKPTTVFTEHGAVMAATVLNSALAVEMSIHVVRAFVMLRRIIASNDGVTRRLAILERSVAALDAETKREFTRVYKAILKLMGPVSAEQ